MRVAVVVATRGRSGEVADLLRMLARQTLPPAAIVLSVEIDGDAPPALPAGVQVVKGPRGLTMQRNRGLDLVEANSDIVVFYDDDYIPPADSLAILAGVFASHPEIAAATGRVLADGVCSGGTSLEDALAIVDAYEAEPPAALEITDCEGVYGCNMAFRCTAIAGKRFDENLPAYGWQEDTDFAGQIATAGRVVRVNRFAGVHRGVQGARSHGVPLGYSQMVNPVYLARKGTVRYPIALAQMGRNFLANHAKLLRPEPHIDRSGRVRGNWIGLWQILRGRADPKNISVLGPRR